MSVNEKMTAIADAIRLNLFCDDKYSLDDMPEAINEVYLRGDDNGYVAGIGVGYEEGYTEGETAGITQGKEAERKAFWNCYQNWGSRTLWQYAFYDWIWQDSIYNPIYDMKVTNALCMFTSSYITNTKVAINITASGEAYRTFYNCIKLHTIPKLGVVEGLAYSEAFYNCTALKNIVIEGVIGNSFNIRWSPLTKESITSIVNALSTTATGKTATFNKAAKEATFTDEEWATLIGTKSNWTISLI